MVWIDGQDVGQAEKINLIGDRRMEGAAERRWTESGPLDIYERVCIIFWSPAYGLAACFPMFSFVLR